jgi:hypothetical protein
VNKALGIIPIALGVIGGVVLLVAGRKEYPGPAVS